MRRAMASYMREGGRGVPGPVDRKTVSKYLTEWSNLLIVKSFQRLQSTSKPSTMISARTTSSLLECVSLPINFYKKFLWSADICRLLLSRPLQSATCRSNEIQARDLPKRTATSILWEGEVCLHQCHACSPAVLRLKPEFWDFQVCGLLAACNPQEGVVQVVAHSAQDILAHTALQGPLQLLWCEGQAAWSSIWAAEVPARKSHTGNESNQHLQQAEMRLLYRMSHPSPLVHGWTDP